jgi:hypothetical protein
MNTWNIVIFGAGVVVGVIAARVMRRRRQRPPDLVRGDTITIKAAPVNRWGSQKPPIKAWTGIRGSVNGRRTEMPITFQLVEDHDRKVSEIRRSDLTELIKWLPEMP